MTQTLFRNFRMLDPERDELVGGCEILVEGESIREVSERPIRAQDALAVDCGGRTLMPGLIDCHAHVVLSEVFLRQLENVPLTLMTARAVVALEAMRQGCDQVKIMMSGGVASPYDPLDSLQFSPGEVAAAVEEAHAFGRYVCAHAYTPEAIERAAHAGVRTIEHGNLIDEGRARLMASKGMLLVANLVTYYAMKERAASLGMPPEMLEKNELVIDGGLRSLEICKRAGVPVAYGTDLLGPLQAEQSREFVLRAQVLSSIEIIRSATSVGARVLRREGKLGCLRADGFADLVVVDGNPLKDISVLQAPEKSLLAIMKGGRFYRNRLRQG